MGNPEYRKIYPQCDILCKFKMETSGCPDNWIVGADGSSSGVRLEGGIKFDVLLNLIGFQIWWGFFQFAALSNIRRFLYPMGFSNLMGFFF